MCKTASAGSSSTRTRTAAGARTCAPTSSQAGHGRGASTASQTAWALLGLLAAGERDHSATKAGVDWLVRNQTEDGTWDEPWFTGTGFPWDFSLNYHLYRHVFPLTALGRYLLGTGPRPKASPRGVE